MIIVFKLGRTHTSSLANTVDEKPYGQRLKIEGTRYPQKKQEMLRKNINNVIAASELV